MGKGKNKGRGMKLRKKGRNREEEQEEEESQELLFKEDGQEYAQVETLLGNCRCHAMCMDGRMRLCHIRGSLQKTVWIAAGDIVLLGLRDFQDYKADIIHKFSADHARFLRSDGLLPHSLKLNANIADDDALPPDLFDFTTQDIDRFIRL